MTLARHHVPDRDPTPTTVRWAVVAAGVATALVVVLFIAVGIAVGIVAGFVLGAVIHGDASGGELAVGVFMYAFAFTVPLSTAGFGYLGFRLSKLWRVEW